MSVYYRIRALRRDPAGTRTLLGLLILYTDLGKITTEPISNLRTFCERTVNFRAEIRHFPDIVQEPGTGKERGQDTRGSEDTGAAGYAGGSAGGCTPSAGSGDARPCLRRGCPLLRTGRAAAPPQPTRGLRRATAPPALGPFLFAVQISEGAQGRQKRSAFVLRLPNRPRVLARALNGGNLPAQREPTEEGAHEVSPAPGRAQKVSPKAACRRRRPASRPRGLPRPPLIALSALQTLPLPSLFPSCRMQSPAACRSPSASCAESSLRRTSRALPALPT